MSRDAALIFCDAPLCIMKRCQSPVEGICVSIVICGMSFTLYVTNVTNIFWLGSLVPMNRERAAFEADFEMCSLICIYRATFSAEWKSAFSIDSKEGVS